LERLNKEKKMQAYTQNASYVAKDGNIIDIDVAIKEINEVKESAEASAAAVSTEAAARAEADTALQGDIDAVGQAIAAESSTRASEDTAIKDGIGALNELSTEAKTTLVGALNELNSGKVNKHASHANGATDINNDDGNDGLSVITTKTDTNTLIDIETNTEAGNPVMGGIVGRYGDTPSEGSRRLIFVVGADGGIRVQLRKNKDAPAEPGDIVDGDNMLNKDEITAAINEATAGIEAVGGLKTPIKINLESELPGATEAENGTYYVIGNMDVTAPGYQGRAWKNDGMSTSEWQTVIDRTAMPDGDWIDLNDVGAMTLTEDVKALIDGAIQGSQILPGEPTAEATDLQVSSAKTIYELLGAALSTLETTSKTVVGAINELQDGKATAAQGAKADTALQSVPQATANTLGGIKAEPITDDDNRAVRIDENGYLFASGVENKKLVYGTDYTMTNPDTAMLNKTITLSTLTFSNRTFLFETVIRMGINKIPLPPMFLNFDDNASLATDEFIFTVYVNSDAKVVRVKFTPEPNPGNVLQIVISSLTDGFYPGGFTATDVHITLLGGVPGKKGNVGAQGARGKDSVLEAIPVSTSDFMDSMITIFPDIDEFAQETLKHHILDGNGNTTPYIVAFKRLLGINSPLSASVGSDGAVLISTNAFDGEILLSSGSAFKIANSGGGGGEHYILTEGDDYTIETESMGMPVITFSESLDVPLYSVHARGRIINGSYETPAALNLTFKRVPPESSEEYEDENEQTQSFSYGICDEKLFAPFSGEVNLTALGIAYAINFNINGVESWAIMATGTNSESFELDEIEIIRI
jgi:hypothetical protein